MRGLQDESEEGAYIIELARIRRVLILRKEPLHVRILEVDILALRVRCRGYLRHVFLDGCRCDYSDDEKETIWRAQFLSV
jgi:hypothetical protein